MSPIATLGYRHSEAQRGEVKASQLNLYWDTTQAVYWDTTQAVASTTTLVQGCLAEIWAASGLRGWTPQRPGSWESVLWSAPQRHPLLWKGK